MIGKRNIEPPEELLENRSSPDERSILDDFRLSNGERVSRLGVALWMLNSDADDAADDDAADDADDAAADDAADADDADDADADADDADDADADDADDADAAADDALIRSRLRLELLLEELNVEEGLKIVTLPGRYGYSATFVCWLRRIAGDEFEMMPGYRFIYRVNERQGLSWLAANGPGKHYKLRAASEVAEHVHRLVLRRVLNADEKAWAGECPRPKEWHREAA